jgi:hypothetical protein
VNPTLTWNGVTMKTTITFVSLTLLVGNYGASGFQSSGFLTSTPTHSKCGQQASFMRSARQYGNINMIPQQSTWSILQQQPRVSPLRASESEEDDEYDSAGKKMKDDPYAGVDYDNVELEFVDYNDPEYKLDQDVDFEEQDMAADADEATLELWREERRKRNDEFQFETYFKKVWNSGEVEYRGEWTTYGTTTFIPELLAQQQEDSTGDDDAMIYPGLVQAKRTIKVISKASRHMANPDAEWRGDREVIRHSEYEVSNESAEPSLASRRDVDIDSGFGRHRDDDDTRGTDSNNDDTKESKDSPSSSRREIEATYWPKEMTSFDFRGPQGNMCVGAAYTICDAVPLNPSSTSEGSDAESHEGPFKEKRIELGIQGDDMRMRVKLYYKVKEEEIEQASSSSPPSLHLCTVTVCRERKDEWPCGERDVNLFGPAGANGGLYDPPPVGGEQQAARYIGMDVEGGASLFFPHAMEQTANAFGTDSEFYKYNWVVSLDWTPSGKRYQVDRKFFGGAKSKGLKSLELSEVQALDADTYRPRKGPADMLQ